MRRIGLSALLMPTIVLSAACSGGESAAGDSTTTVESPTDSTAVTEELDLESFMAENGVDIASISKTLEESTLYSTFFEVLSEAELNSLLDGEGPFTVFVPSNAAFKKLPDGTLDKLLLPENRETLLEILKFHIVEGEYRIPDIANGSLTSLQGAPISVEYFETTNFMETLKINGKFVVIPNIKATNGTMHIINWIMLPPGVDLSAL